MSATNSLDELRDALRLACQPSYVPKILTGRERLLVLSREWVLQNIEAIARAELNLSDYWEYGRLLEVLDLLGAKTHLEKLIQEGRQSDDEDVRDLAEIFKEKRTS